MGSLIAAIDAAQEKAKSEGIDYGDRRYLPVKDRLEIFRRAFAEQYGINTNVQFQMFPGNEMAVVVHATITDQHGTIKASGHGMIFYGRDDVAKNSPVEAAETFAIGRALASFGLFGSEYASANEMERIKAKPEPKKNEQFANEMHDKYHGMPPKEAAFRRAVDESFPPKVGKAEWFIPADNSADSMESVYAEIAKLKNKEELSAYFTLLEESMQWMSPEDVQEIKSTFKSRRSQIEEDANGR